MADLSVGGLLTELDVPGLQADHDIFTDVIVFSIGTEQARVTREILRNAPFNPVAYLRDVVVAGLLARARIWDCEACEQERPYLGRLEEVLLPPECCGQPMALVSMAGRAR